MRLANKLYVFLPRDPLQEAESSRLCGSAARSSRGSDSTGIPGAAAAASNPKKGFPLPTLAAPSPSAMERQIPVLRVR